MWKNEKFYLTEKKFREFNSLVRLLLSRKFCQKSVRENFRNFLTVIYQPTNATDLFFAQSCHLCSTSSPECKIKLLLCSLTENGITENKGKKCVLLVAKIKVFSNGKNSSNYTTICRSFWLVRHISLLSRNTGGDKMETGWDHQVYFYGRGWKNYLPNQKGYFCKFETWKQNLNCT